jgi:hypothetical protein
VWTARQRTTELLEDQHMYRVRQNRKVWRTKWPLRKLFPPKVDERFCKKCRLPHQDGPQPKPVTTLVTGHAGAYAYPSGGWKRGQLVFEFGRFKAFGDSLKLSHFVLEDDLDDLLELVTHARAYRDQKGKKKPQRL